MKDKEKTRQEIIIGLLIVLVLFILVKFVINPALHTDVVDNNETKSTYTDRTFYQQGYWDGMNDMLIYLSNTEQMDSTAAIHLDSLIQMETRKEKDRFDNMFKTE